jgi:BASS family bile acid:Na+ symporter
VGRLAPGLARRLAGPLSVVATILLLLGVLPILFASWPAITALFGNGTVVALAAFAVAGLLTGHMLGGPDPHERVVLALATASRHPGIALAIAAAEYPQEKLVPGAIAWYFIVSTIVSVLYVRWYRRQLQRMATAATR